LKFLFIYILDSDLTKVMDLDLDPDPHTQLCKKSQKFVEIVDFRYGHGLKRLTSS
jgi:hypothetical protein